GQSDAGDARNGAGLTNESRVKPTAAALTRGHGDEFVALLAQHLAHFVVQFRWERAGTHPGAVSLYNAKDQPRRAWTKARTAGNGAADSVGAGNERIGAVVHVQQHALRAFEQNLGASLAHIAQALPHWLRELLHERRDGAQIFEKSSAIHLGFAKTGAQRIMVRAQAVKLGFKVIKVCKIAHANGAAANLVFVSRANAAAGGADLALASSRFTKAVQLAVNGQDQRAVVSNAEIFRS